MLITNYGDISLGPLNISGPIKARIGGRFIPSFTIDLSTMSTGSGILSFVKPKIDLLVGGQAYEYDYGQGGLRSIDPSIFNQDTFIDTLNKLGIIPVLTIIGGIGIGLYFLVRRK